MVVLEYSTDLSRLSVTALDNNKNKIEYIVIFYKNQEVYSFLR